MFSLWQDFAAHRRPKSVLLKSGMTDEVNRLEKFVARNIRSRSTVETIETVHRKTNQPLNSRGVFRRGGEGAQKESFEALLYTDIGNKRIAEFITYPRTYDPKTKKGRQKIAMTLRFEAWHP